MGAHTVVLDLLQIPYEKVSRVHNSQFNDFLLQSVCNIVTGCLPDSLIIFYFPCSHRVMTRWMTSWPWHIHFSKTFAKETIRIKFSYINSWTSSSLQGCVDMTMLHFFSCWHTFGCPLSSSATAVWFLLMNDSVCRLSERYHLHNSCFSPAAGSWDDAPHLYEQLPAVQWDQWAGGPSFCPLHRNARKTCSVPQVFANHCEGWYKICKEMSGQSHDRGLFLLFVFCVKNGKKLSYEQETLMWKFSKSVIMYFS